MGRQPQLIHASVTNIMGNILINTSLRVFPKKGYML